MTEIPGKDKAELLACDLNDVIHGIWLAARGAEELRNVTEREVSAIRELAARARDMGDELHRQLTDLGTPHEEPTS